MDFVRFVVVKLSLLSDRIFLYIENEYFISTKIISTHFMQEVSFKSNLII
jgi:hypothetical protein